MNLTDYFNSHFEILPVDTDALLEEVFKLRYQVFCVENEILKSERYQDFKERDIYDIRSDHRLIRHKTSGIYVASVRLILHDSDALEKPFPMEEYYGKSLYKEAPLCEDIPRKSLAEVSRFLVSKERERKIMDASSQFYKEEAIGSYCERRDGMLCYLLLFGLFAAVIHMTSEHNVSYWYVCVEQTFFRLLKRFSIGFTPIGPAFEYNGKRLPCLGSTASILSGIRQYRPELWDFLTQKGKVVPFISQHNVSGDVSAFSKQCSA